MGRIASIALWAGLALSAASAVVADDDVEEARRAIGALEASSAPSRAAEEQLEGVIASLERHARAHDLSFRTASVRALPEKARQRLEAARSAYTRGRGRLLEILKSLRDDDLTSIDRERLASEASALIERIESVSRRRPLSSGDQSLKAPELEAPPLGVQTTVAASGLQVVGGGGALGPVPQVLRDAAAEFDGPVAIYEWVRNNIRPEFYYGLMKGGAQAYLERSGNDADTASVLIGMLKAQSVPARFVRGTALIPTADVIALTGTSNALQAVRVLERAGVPHEVLLGGGGVASVKWERVWVEAYLPYANYRGTLLSDQGKEWVPLDPWFKRLQAPGGIDVVEDLGVDPRAELDAYLATVQSETPAEFVRRRVAERLEVQRPELTFDDILAGRGFVSETLGILPSTLPYEVDAVTEVSGSFPRELTHEIRIVGETGDRTLLDLRLPLPDVVGRRLTLSYVPAEAADEDIVAEFGGVFSTPPYLVEVRPIVKVAGIGVSEDTGPIGLGVRYTLRLELVTPGGTETVENEVLAGNLLAIGLGGRAVTSSEADEDAGASILAARALSYWRRWNASDDELARLFRVVPVRPTVSACLVLSDVEVEYLGGDGLYPIRFEWMGIAIDADLRASAPVGLDSRDRERDFLLISGLEGSVLEHRVFEDDLEIESVSTAKALQLAADAGIQVVDITAANVDLVVPTLPFDWTVKNEIQTATGQGLLARISTQAISHLSWTGIGYLLLDEETGEASYQLQGGRSGGVTAPAVIDLPTDLVEKLKRQSEEIAPEGTEVAQIQKFTLTDFQFGTVGLPLERRLRVLATDAEGQAVPNAAVIFTVIGGGGFLIDPRSGTAGRSEVGVFSNEFGEAEVEFVLGTRTNEIPRFATFEGDTNATQVGLNLVTTRSGLATLQEPFTAFSLPDVELDGEGQRMASVQLTQANDDPGPYLSNLSVADLVQVSVTDRFGNPISNIPIRAAFVGPPVKGTPPAGALAPREATTTPGHVLNAEDYTACLASRPSVIYGTCPGEAEEITIESDAQGINVYPVVGDSPFSAYNYEIGPEWDPAAVTLHYGTTGPLCRIQANGDCAESKVRPALWVLSGQRPRITNSLGNMIEAYSPGQEGDVSFWADVLYEKEDVTPVPNTSPQRYRVTGNNQWVREPLTGSQYTVTPVTTGTTVSSPTAIDEGNGTYRTAMVMSATPQLNVVSYGVAHRPKVVQYVSPGSLETTEVETDPASGEFQAKRTPAPVPWRSSGTFGLWSVRPRVASVSSTSVFLTAAGVTAIPTTFGLSIEPAEFAQGLTGANRHFAVSRDAASILVDVGARSTSVMPAGLPLVSGTHEASYRLEGVSPLGPITSAPQVLNVGRIRVIVDSNNDTRITGEDLDQPENKAWTFWEADASGSTPPEIDEITPEDWATIGISSEIPITDDDFVVLTLTGGGTNRVPIFAVRSKAQPGLEYLQSETASLKQFNPAQFPASTSVGGLVGLGSLPDGEYDFLFSCLECPRNRLAVAVVGADGQRIVVDSRPASVRPIERLMGAFSIRRPVGFVPAGFAAPIAGWASVPGEFTNFIVLLHGFNVSEGAALEDFFPKFLKRLYWSGAHVLEAQGSFVVGVAWPGNESLPLPPWIPDPTAPFYFPEDELRALQSGIPLSRLLRSLSLSGTIDVIAHSLGNLVVNSALSRIDERLVDTYIMYDAAIPAEVFDDKSGKGDIRTDLDSHAKFLGFPDDRVWVLGEFLRDSGAWDSALGKVTDQDPSVVPLPLFTRRWKQQRPASGVPDTTRDPIPARGPWPGLFAANKNKAEIVNAYSSNDLILGVIWPVSHVVQKPNTLIPIQALPDQDGKFWATLKMRPRDEIDLWFGEGAHGNLRRQWAELAHWFPARSSAVGHGPHPGLSNLPFSTFGEIENEILEALESHNYLLLKEFWEVYDAYVQLRSHLE